MRKKEMRMRKTKGNIRKKDMKSNLMHLVRPADLLCGSVECHLPSGVKPGPKARGRGPAVVPTAFIQTLGAGLDITLRPISL